MLLIKYENDVVPHSSIGPTSGMMVRDVKVWYQSHGFNAEPGWSREVVFGPNV
jgi:hypothetical protein